MQAEAPAPAGEAVPHLDASTYARSRSSNVNFSGPSSLHVPGSLPSQRQGLGRTTAKPQRAVEELLTALRKASFVLRCPDPADADGKQLWPLP